MRRRGSPGSWETRVSEPTVGIVMGSDSDWPVMEAAGTALTEFGIPWESDVVSAHRMPAEMLAYGADAAGRGLRVIIAGARGSGPPAGHARRPSRRCR